MAHDYDQLGRRVLELSRHGEPLAAWAYSYDPDGRITRVVDPAGGETRLAYDPAGRIAEVAHPNDVTATWSWDRAGQPAALTVTFAYDGLWPAGGPHQRRRAHSPGLRRAKVYRRTRRRQEPHPRDHSGLLVLSRHGVGVRAETGGRLDMRARLYDPHLGRL